MGVVQAQLTAQIKVMYHSEAFPQRRHARSSGIGRQIRPVDVYIYNPKFCRLVMGIMNKI